MSEIFSVFCHTWKRVWIFIIPQASVCFMFAFRFHDIGEFYWLGFISLAFGCLGLATPSIFAVCVVKYKYLGARDLAMVLICGLLLVVMCFSLNYFLRQGNLTKAIASFAGMATFAVLIFYLSRTSLKKGSDPA